MKLLNLNCFYIKSYNLKDSKKVKCSLAINPINVFQMPFFCACKKYFTPLCFPLLEILSYSCLFF